MLVKILGGIDIILGLILIFIESLDLPSKALVAFGFILLAKSSLGFLKDFASWIDFTGGILFLILIILEIPSIVNIIVGILIIQKGALSFA